MLLWQQYKHLLSLHSQESIALFGIAVFMDLFDYI